MTVLLEQRPLRAMCWRRKHELLWSHLFPEVMPIPPRPPWDSWGTASPLLRLSLKPSARGVGVCWHTTVLLFPLSFLFQGDKAGHSPALQKASNFDHQGQNPVLVLAWKGYHCLGIFPLPWILQILSPQCQGYHTGEREAAGIRLQLTPVGWWKGHTIHLQL